VSAVPTLDGRRVRPDLLHAVDRSLVRAAPAHPAVVVWRWRYELGSVAALALVWAWAVWAVGPVPAVLVLAVLLGGAAASSTVRRWVVARAWCVITAHRVRVGCIEALVYSRAGKIPVVLATHAVPYGEEVLLWCRAGTSAEDLERARPVLAAACWASDVWVAADPGRAHLVTLGVVRRWPREGGLYPFGWRGDPGTTAAAAPAPRGAARPRPLGGRGSATPGPGSAAGSRR